MSIIDLKALQAAVRSWIEENVPSDTVLPSPNEDLTPDMEEWIRAIRRDFGDRGWLAPRWPTYFGGGGFPAAAAVIEEEMRRPQDASFWIEHAIFGGYESVGDRGTEG